MTTGRNHKVRKIKIELTGDFAKCDVKPQIRLKGLWLLSTGMVPNSYVEISNLKEGVLILRCFKA